MAQFVYVDGIAAPGNFTTSGSANTEADAMDFIAASTGTTVNLLLISCGGKSSGLTTLTAIELRVRKYGTASTAGTASSIVPVDPNVPAVNTPHVVHWTYSRIYSHEYDESRVWRAAGPGGWVAPIPTR